MENYKRFLEIINRYGLDGEKVLDLITDWHGTDVITDAFLENLDECEGLR